MSRPRLGNNVQVPFRLTREHVDRLDRAAKQCGQTRQEFLRSTVLAEVAEVEERKRLKKIHVIRNRDRLTDDGDDLTGEVTETTGLGIANAIHQEHKEEKEERKEENANHRASPVVVQVGGSPGANNDTIDRLSFYVVNGQDFERSNRRRTALNILHGGAYTEEERKTLTARLDEAIASKVKTKDNSGSVGRVARIAFDKLASMIKGD